ncbi:MAG: hypothetical protein IJO75_00725 [Clostridia bacterium]|nr:hypothetical protein [Clostridia bacterium]
MKRSFAFVLDLILIISVVSCRYSSETERFEEPSFTNAVIQTSVSITVYVTDTGECYHREDCGALWSSKHALPLEKAISKKYRACQRCNPPKTQ